MSHKTEIVVNHPPADRCVSELDVRTPAVVTAVGPLYVTSISPGDVVIRANDEVVYINPRGAWYQSQISSAVKNGIRVRPLKLGEKVTITGV